MKRWFVMCSLLVACGGADQAPKSPTSTHHDNELPGTLDEAEADLVRSKAEVEQASECEQLCKAFQSMRRAQAAMCVLTGEDDPRCQHAKQTVEDAAKRVAKCSCPGSTSP